MTEDSAEPSPPSHLRVVAEWSGGTERMGVRRVTATAARDGSFQMCGIPIDAAVSINASADGAKTASPVVVNFVPGKRLVRVPVLMLSKGR